MRNKLFSHDPASPGVCIRHAGGREIVFQQLDTYADRWHVAKAVQCAIMVTFAHSRNAMSRMNQTPVGTKKSLWLSIPNRFDALHVL